MLPERRNQGTLHPQDLDRATAMPPSSLYTLHQAHPFFVDIGLYHILEKNVMQVPCARHFLYMNDSQNQSQVTQDTTLARLSPTLAVHHLQA